MDRGSLSLSLRYATIILAPSTAMLNGERTKRNFTTDEKIAD